MIPNATKYLNALKPNTNTRVLVLSFDDCPKNKKLSRVKKIDNTININSAEKNKDIGLFKIVTGKNIL